MNTYSQSSGKFTCQALIAFGYSGNGDGKNNPAKQDVHNVGPIPQGEWTIVGEPFDTTTHGPFVLRLEPKDGTETFGRSGFLIHGDSVTHPGTASEGCIILPRIMRQTIWSSGERDVLVTA